MRRHFSHLAIAACAVLATWFTASAALAQAVADEQQGATAAVQTEPRSSAPKAAAGETAPFDPEAATRAYLDSMTAEQKTRSDAYFEGGYWLQLWGFLYGAVVAVLLLATRLSVRMRDLSERITRRKPLQTALYWLQYLVITTLFTFPLTVYQEYFRDHAYGLATQTFGPWVGDQLKGLGLGAVLGAMALMLIYGVVRRVQSTWWVWGSVVSVAFLAFTAAIAPVFITPVFNDYKPLADERIREPILSLARANAIPVHDVYVFDASRQTTRISANVSGFAGTERISLNDNLVNRCSLPAIEAVMAHEMGHYVLNHVYSAILEFGLVIVLGFAFLRWGFAWSTAHWGERWGIRGIGDVAGMPLAILLLSVYFFLMTPVTNTITRVIEVEADLYGLNAARQPDGAAEAAMLLAEYRKMEPSPLEEWILYDHPSGRTRIGTAMRWKAENLK